MDIGDRGRNKTTRRRFLQSAAAGAAWIALTSTLGCRPDSRTQATASSARPEDVRTFRSRPDLSPPGVRVDTPAKGAAPGYIFVAAKKGPGQDGPMILDDSGEPVWFRPLPDEDHDAMDFKAQRYRGEPVLTWWEGPHTGYGRGEHVILDGSYREIIRVRAGNGYLADHHELVITPEDTALLTIYGRVPTDLSPFGGSKDGMVLEGIVQEVDIATGEVLFEWHSLEHVGIEETYYEAQEKPGWPFDYFHINSIDVDNDGDLIVSARRTSTVYKIDRETGEVRWRLGGKKSDFEMYVGSRRAYQHDARRHPDGTLTLFDNGILKVDEESRGLVLELDEDAMTTRLVRQYTPPDMQVSETQGNVQVLPNGNVFIGWGSEPVYSEFSGDGKLLYSASFLHPDNESYRAFRFPWSGRPHEDPSVAAERKSDDEVTLFASWNGATEVASWQVVAGPGPDRMETVGSAPREGFETVITVHTDEPYVGVRAENRSGRVLGASEMVRPATRGETSPEGTS